jgi:hypothetical protein
VRSARRRIGTLAALIPSLALASAARAHDGSIGWIRPKFQVALGLGASIDKNPPNPHPDRAISAFFFAAGLGDGGIGLELRAFANGATATQVTRLAVEPTFVLRPFEPALRLRESYGARVLRGAAVDLGPSIERVSLGPLSARRFGVMFGAHADLPVAEAGVSKEMRIRLGVRKLHAARVTLGGTAVDDSALELYAQLAFVF